MAIIHNYQTVGNSRCLSIVSSDEDLEKARRRVVDSIEKFTDNSLEWRSDIATQDNILKVNSMLR